MEHFHVVRWNAVHLATGENIPVADLDFASVATALEAERVTGRLAARGQRCTSYACRDSNCTLHAPRPIRFAGAVS